MKNDERNTEESKDIENKLARLEKMLKDLKLKHEIEEYKEREKEKRKYEWPEID